VDGRKRGSFLESKSLRRRGERSLVSSVRTSLAKAREVRMSEWGRRGAGGREEMRRRKRASMKG